MDALTFSLTGIRDNYLVLLSMTHSNQLESIVMPLMIYENE